MIPKRISNGLHFEEDGPRYFQTVQQPTGSWTSHDPPDVSVKIWNICVMHNRSKARIFMHFLVYIHNHCYNIFTYIWLYVYTFIYLQRSIYMHIDITRVILKHEFFDSGHQSFCAPVILSKVCRREKCRSVAGSALLVGNGQKNDGKNHVLTCFHRESKNMWNYAVFF